VLLVDDELMIRTLARTILEQAGHTVIEAEDGAEAVEVFAREHGRIDLVILDLTMPRLSGRDAFDRMVALDPSARVLFSSGYSGDDLSAADGAKGLLSKPYRPADLLAAVRRALETEDAPAAV
jgi:CheY-like chemotaxis protein